MRFSLGLGLLLWIRIAVAATPLLEVTVEGIEDPLLKNVLAFMTIYQHRDDAKINVQWLTKANQKADSEIKLALQPFGYYRPIIKYSLRQENGLWVAHYRIDPGVAIRISKSNITLTGSGRNQKVLQAAVQAIPLKSGDVLDQTVYRKSKKGLMTLTSEQGYFDAKFTIHKIMVDLDRYMATVSLQMDTGSRFHFGEIKFSDTALDKTYLRKYLTIKSGDFYSTENLHSLRRALMETGYFKHVTVNPQFEKKQNGAVPVRVELAMRSAYQLKLGAGYATDSGVRGRIQLLNRYVNQWGHKFDVNARVSQLRQTLDAKYTIPLDEPRIRNFNLTSSLSQQDIPVGLTRTARFGGNRTGIRWGLREVLALDFQYENFFVEQDIRDSYLTIPSISWSSVQVELAKRADSAHLFHRGFRFNINLRGAVEYLLSDSSFVQLRVGGAWAQEIWESARLITRAEVGWTAASDFDNLPTTLRYFAGGDQSVRGYDYHSLGPKDREGHLLGGRHLGVASMEYEQMVYGPWGFAVFYDMGNAFNDFNLSEFKHGTGLGLRWKSPVGLVKADVAMALSDSHHQIRFHIVMGTGL
ncbi:MAG: autotransporter assembly complex family protein [Methylococcales bacterium]